MDYEAILQEFYRLERFGIKLGLDVITELLRRLGDPQLRFPAVHVTGTNGKGSVCAFVSTVLQEAGYTCGLYTSPHLVRFNERIRVDGRLIADAEVMRLYEAIRPHMAAMAARNPADHPTFFEATTAMAFQHFAERRVDVAVVEVGMGGRYDATNVVRPAVSVLTRIGLEHAEHLGRTVRRIAREKSGIIKATAPAVSAPQEPEALLEIEARCRAMGSSLTVAGRDLRVEAVSSGIEGQRLRMVDGGSVELDIALPGRFQQENAALAYGTLRALREGGWAISDEALRAGFRKARWPGRFEFVRQEPWVIVDSGHNGPAVAALAEGLRESLPRPEVTLVMGVLADKEIDAMAASLLPFTRRLVAVRPKTERALDPERVVRSFAVAAEHAGVPPPAAEVIPDGREAVTRVVAAAGKDEVVLVAGSVYLAGEALEALGRAP